MTTSAKPDYWSLLGVDSDCTDQQLKRAFAGRRAAGTPISTATIPLLKSASSWSMRPMRSSAIPAGVRPGREGVVPVRMLPIPLPRASLILRITSM